MKLKVLYFIIIIVITNLNSFSTHISGGDLTYKCIGGNQYELTLKLFRDCDGINAPTSASVRFSNNCGITNPPSLLMDIVPNTNTGEDYTNISQLCPSDSLNSTCFNGLLPGMQLYEYKDTVTLPANCDSWRFYYTTSARNNSIINANATGIYLGATLNNTLSPCNSSPVYTSHPVPYVCINQLTNYNFGVVEADGDNLSYQFIAAQSGSTPTPSTYASPYTLNSPITSITLDNLTGQLQFTPTVLGNFVVVVQVTERDGNGNIIGTTFRDIQFVVQNCNNQVVDPSTISIINHNGAGVVSSSKELEACEGDQFCFDLSIQDPDLNDTLSISSNINTVLQGATVIYSGINPVIAQVCWTVPVGANNFNIINFDARDNACPIVGQANFSITIRVINNTNAGPNDTICLGENATLKATSGSTFNWTAISGPAISVGTNFSCNPCSNPIASPTSTTSYEVISDLNGCSNTDTITITVVPNFTYNISQSSASSCQLEDIDFNISVNNPGTFNYYWTPDTMLNANNISNPTFTPTSSGNFTYYTTISSSAGCIKQDSVTVYASQSLKPSVIANTDVDTIRCNEIPNLLANVDSSIAIIDFEDDFEGNIINPLLWNNSNGVTITNTCGTRNNSLGALRFDGRTGDRNATTVPFQSNICSTIDFYLKPAVNGGGCNKPEVNDDLLLEYSVNGGSSWIGLMVFDVNSWSTTPVFQSFSIPIPTSINPVILRFNQPTTNYTGGSFDYWMLDDVSVTCSSLGNYTYSWSSATNLATPNSMTTIATPPITETFQVIVTETSGGCSDTSSVVIAVKDDYPDVKFDADNFSGCYPVKVNFTNLTSPNKVGTVNWDFGNGITNTNTPNSGEITFDTPGVYSINLEVTSPFGCIADTTITNMISVYDYPIADFSASPQPTNVSNSIINFQDLSSSDAITWKWDFGIGNLGFVDSSNLQSPSSKYPDDKGDNYDVILIVSNSDGCYDTITKEVVVNDLYTMYIPNSFTPNGDGFNDFFKPSGEQISSEDYQFRIFDRWGNLMFITVNPEESWDGKNNSDNLKCNSGAYSWIIKSKNANNGDEHTHRGHVFLLE